MAISKRSVGCTGLTVTTLGFGGAPLGRFRVDVSERQGVDTVRDIDALNNEMKAAGVRVFVRGLRLPRSAMSLRAQPDGEILATDGPHLTTDTVPVRTYRTD